MLIKILKSFTITANPDEMICINDEVQLLASGGNNYAWSPSSSLDNASVANPVASPTETTTYIVYSTDGVCFDSQDSVVVTVHQTPMIFAGADAEIMYGSTYQLNAFTNGTNILWTPSYNLSCNTCPDPIVNHLDEATTYYLQVTDSIGCRAEDSVRISLVCDQDLVFVPNAFTPNGDNKNDVFRIRTYGLSKLNYFRVFNRWGEMVFETTDVTKGWDGTWKGQPCTPAVFVYYIDGACANGSEILKQGNVSLIR